MAVVNTWAKRLFCSAEATFDTIPIFAAGDAMAFIDADFGATQKARTSFRRDKTGTRSPATSLVHGQKDPVEATFSRSFAPGTTTTMDTHELLTNAFGTLSTSTYSVAAEPTDSLSILLGDSDARRVEILSGAVVTRWVLSAPEVGEVIETFTIQAARKAEIHSTTLNTTLSDGVGTTIIFDDPECFVNAHGASITIESEEIQLSTDPADFTYAASTLTVANCTRGYNSTSGAAHTSGVAVTPTITSTTTAKVPIAEKNWTFAFASTSYDVLSSEITLETGRRLRVHERGNDYSTGVVAGTLTVSATSTHILDTGTDSRLPGHAERNKAGTAVWTFGTTAANIGTLTLAAAELITPSVPVGDDDTESRLTLGYFAYGSSGNDDIQLVCS